MTFDSYALNEDELILLKKKLESDDIESSIKFASQGTEESIKQLQEDLNHFLEDKKDEKEEKKKDDSNPFSAIWSVIKEGISFKSDKKQEKKEIKDIKDIKKDEYVEKAVRDLAAKAATGSLYTLYDVYKKAHGHASSPESFDF
jgi:hypothetical protein